MNSRYLIVLLLLGGMVYGLTTAVGGMQAEDEPMSVCPAQVEWSSVPNVGVSAPAERSFSVPASSRHGSSLFHHPAVYSGVSVPQGYSGSGLTTGVPSSGTYAVSSAYSPSQGLYLTSSAVLQSYGGGAESGMCASSGSHSAVSSVSPSSTGVSLGAMSVSPVAYSPSYSSAFSSAAPVYASADQTLSARKGAQRRKNGVTIEDTYYQWLQSNSWAFGAGADNLSESQVRALWDALCANNEDFALTYTYEEFYNWFLSKQSDETFKWKLPVGEGVPCLLLLCVGYVIVRYKQQKNQWI